MDKNAVTENVDHNSIEEDKEDCDDKKPMIAKEATKDSLMETIIGRGRHQNKTVKFGKVSNLPGKWKTIMISSLGFFSSFFSSIFF